MRKLKVSEGGFSPRNAAVRQHGWHSDLDVSYHKAFMLSVMSGFSLWGLLWETPPRFSVQAAVTEMICVYIRIQTPKHCLWRCPLTGPGGGPWHLGFSTNIAERLRTTAWKGGSFTFTVLSACPLWNTHQVTQKGKSEEWRKSQLQTELSLIATDTPCSLMLLVLNEWIGVGEIIKDRSWF